MPQSKLFRSVFVLNMLLAVATQAQEGRIVSRLFWQDDATATLCWGDLRKHGDAYSIDPRTIDDFPKLDDAEQSLVQMVSDEGLILVGVRDHADGTIGSGWVAIDAGLTEHSHGDHTHWSFSAVPQVLAQQIDSQQGNPAHVYRYGKSFVLANDSKNGFTIASASSIRHAKDSTQAGTFYQGGNGHITLAVVENQVAYATWIAADGDDGGRVDVIGLGDNTGKKTSFTCPTARLHGATVHQGKAFFAPADGVCWVEVDREVDDAPNTTKIHHISLGTDSDDKPLRTGAFKTLGGYVLCTAGTGEHSKLCLLNASSTNPFVIDLPIELDDEQSLQLSVAFDSAGRGPVALMFAESSTTPEADQLWLAELDPNRDGDFSDALVRPPIAVGPSRIVQHSGHHGAAVLARGRQVAITNPGDATIWICSLSDLTIDAKMKVSGTPTRVLSEPQE